MAPLDSMAMLQSTVVQRQCYPGDGFRAALQVAVMQECGLDGMHPGRSTLQQAAALLQRALEVSELLPQDLLFVLGMVPQDPSAKLSRPADHQQCMAPGSLAAVGGVRSCGGGCCGNCGRWPRCRRHLQLLRLPTAASWLGTRRRMRRHGTWCSQRTLRHLRYGATPLTCKTVGAPTSQQNGW